MKIIDYKAYPIKNEHFARGGMYWFLVKLETDSGITGWGETYWNSYGAEAFIHSVKDIYELIFHNEDPFDIEKLYASFFLQECKQHTDLAKIGIFSGFELACWDIIGKSLKLPVYKLLGGKCRDRIRTYSYIYPENPAAMGESTWYSPEAAAERAMAYKEMGYTGIKFDPVKFESQYQPFQPTLEGLDQSEEVIAAIRKKVGPHFDIIIGTHGQFTPSAAVKFARRMEPYNPMWFEEPIPPEQASLMKRVAESTTIPIATGERLATRYEYVPLLEAGVDIVQIDVSGAGGLLESKKIASMAEAYHALYTPHSYAGPLSLAAQIQLDTCQPNFLIQEMVGPLDEIALEMVPEGLNWKGGYLIPSDLPGMGVIVDEAVMEKYRYESYDELDPVLYSGNKRNAMQRSGELESGL